MTVVNRSALTVAERYIFVFFALTLIIVSIMLANNPAKLESTKKDSAGKITESTTTEQLRNDLIVLFTAAGFVLFFIGVNGSRLTKLSVGTVTADLVAPELKAAELFSAARRPIYEVSGNLNEQAAESNRLAPDGSPSGKVIFEGDVWCVYNAHTTSARAIQEALNLWPDDRLKPDFISELSFALAKKQAGNWQWLLKFSDQPPVKVT